MPQDADSTLCNNSLKLVAFSSRKMLWGMVTMVLKPFIRRNIKKLGLFSTCEYLLSKDTDNSDSHNDI